MRVILNGEDFVVDNEKLKLTLADLVLKFYSDGVTVAAVNRKFIPKNQHDKFQINEDDEIDILTPMQGG